MRLQNIGEYKNIYEFVQAKLLKFKDEVFPNPTFKVLFDYMHKEENNIFCEYTDGYRIKKVTYKDIKNSSIITGYKMKEVLKYPKNSIVGIYMDNSINWIKCFWSILMVGYKPLLLNLRLNNDIIEDCIHEFDIKAIISDNKQFSVDTYIFNEINDGIEINANINLNAIYDDDWGEEVIFMSSGTNGSIKLCSYDVMSFYYQLGNSVDIVKKCKNISKHYKNELKLLVLLPFYHVFGFIAMYLWFAFFSRTFVFLKDMSPNTIQNTVKKHNVTHIFAVPLVWDLVRKAAIHKIKQKGDKVYESFNKGINLVNKGTLLSFVAKRKLNVVRESLFGNSIKFLISGGGNISNETLEFFNGIGYNLVNGYGMTEVGITSVEISSSAKVRNLGSVGTPFVNTKYSLNEDNQLLIKSRSMAKVIYQNGKKYITNYDEWFNSYDLAILKDDRYYLQGRSDDIIVLKNGENLNTQLIESNIHITNCDNICIIGINDEPIMIISSSSVYSIKRFNNILNEANQEIERLNLSGVIHKIIITPNKLIEKNDIKISRYKVKENYLKGLYKCITNPSESQNQNYLMNELIKTIQSCFAQALSKNEEDIELNMHFFNDLNGSSIEYFVLSDLIYQKFEIDIKNCNNKSLCTIDEISKFIVNSEEN